MDTDTPSLNSIPYFKHPVTICFLDDDKLFLDSIKPHLSTNNKEIHYFTSQDELLDFYNNAPLFASKIDKFKKIVDPDDLETICDEDIIEIDHPNIAKEIYDKTRFKTPAIFIVDYSMPEINGVDFLKKIDDQFIKKIILTGYADNDIGVEILNKRIIDRFSGKSSKHIKNGQLNSLIDDLIWEYFIDLSNNIYPANKIKRSKQYIKIFLDWINRKNITEFYECNKEGSMLGFNKKGDIFWLMIMSDSQIFDMYDIAYQARAPKNILNKLKNKTHFPFLFSEYEQMLSVDHWNKYLFKIQGKFDVNGEIYTYSFLDNNFFSINKNKYKKF